MESCALAVVAVRSLRPRCCGRAHSLDYWMSSTIRSIDEFDCAAALDVKREREEGGVEWRKMNNK